MDLRDHGLKSMFLSVEKKSAEEASQAEELGSNSIYTVWELGLFCFFNKLFFSFVFLRGILQYECL